MYRKASSKFNSLRQLGTEQTKEQMGPEAEGRHQDRE